MQSVAVMRPLKRCGPRTAPNRPGAWPTTTAARKAIDRLRRESKRDGKHREAPMLHDETPSEPLGAVDDDRLRLMFFCCHPALSTEARLALVGPANTGWYRLTRGPAAVRAAGGTRRRRP